jgi:hypothetical protein
MTTLLSDPEHCEVTIRRDGTTLWVNTEEGCILRVQGIKNLTLVDERKQEDKIEFTEQEITHILASMIHGCPCLHIGKIHEEMHEPCNKIKEKLKKLRRQIELRQVKE